MDDRSSWTAYFFLAIGVFVPWIASYAEQGRWPNGPQEMTAELVTSVVMVILGYAAISVIRKQTYLLGDQNQRLESLAKTDGLTGLYNHRAFLDVLKDEVKNAEMRGSLLSLVFVDLDGFKEFNDEYGHVEGDRVLRETAKLMKNRLGSWTEWVFRYGGDEFAAIVPGKTDAQVGRAVQPLADELRMASHGRCSLSAGVKQWRRGMSLSEFVSASDTAMYRAKDNQAERVVVG